MVGKVEDSSKYWLDWDSDRIYYFICWNESTAKNVLLKNKQEFLLKYSLLTHKYGMCVVPYEELNYENLKNNINKIVESKTDKFPDNWIPICFNDLYTRYNYIQSSHLYVGKIKKLDCIVNARFLYTLEDILKKGTNKYNEYHGNFANPLKIELFQNHITISFPSNALLPILYGEKTGWSTRYIDNSDLAYLNGTRFNSFFRDLKFLCFEYGADKINHEEDHLYYLKKDPVKVNSESGILFNGEIIYYEDIYDMLPEEHKYKSFEEIQIELDNTRYNEYLNYSHSAKSPDLAEQTKTKS